MSNKPSAVPVGTKLLVLPDKSKEGLSRGGIIIPTTANSQLEEGTVVLISEEVQYIKEGDRILYPRNVGVDHEFGGTLYKFLNGPTASSHGDIWAIL